MLLRLLACIAMTACAHAQQFPLTYLGDISALGWEELGGESSKDLRVGRVFPESDAVFRFEGRDRSGKPWRVWTERGGIAVSLTRVWLADLDGNGASDLVIGTAWGSNGRCADGGTLTTLMFDEARRPTPSVFQVHIADWESLPELMDVDQDGHAELVVTDCQYSELSEPPRFGADRWIAGVYEARASRWVPLPATEVRARFSGDDSAHRAK